MSEYGTFANTSGLKGIDSYGLKAEQYGSVFSAILAPIGTYIDTVANSRLFATWQGKITQEDKDDQWKKLPNFVNFENTTVQDEEEDFPIQSSALSRKGFQAGIGYVNVPLLVNNNLKLVNDLQWGIFIITGTGFILGKSSDGIKFEPLAITKFRVGTMPLPAPGDAVKVPITFALEKEQTILHTKITTGLDATQLRDLRPLNLAVSGTSATAGTSTVTDAFTGIAVTGLVNADFVLVDDEGGSETIVSTTDNGDGTYTHDWTTLGADGYVLDFEDPATLSINDPLFYESNGSQEFTIS
jgi:hypothetical protein